MKRLPNIVRCREMVHLEVELIGDVVHGFSQEPIIRLVKLGVGEVLADIGTDSQREQVSVIVDVELSRHGCTILVVELRWNVNLLVLLVAICRSSVLALVELRGSRLRSTAKSSPSSSNSATVFPAVCFASGLRCRSAWYHPHGPCKACKDEQASPRRRTSPRCS